MRCPSCEYSISKVTNSREAEGSVRRRRECRRCGVRFTTYERIQSSTLIICKQDGRREEFNSEKLISGLRKACAKRPIPSRTVEKMAEESFEAAVKDLREHTSTINLEHVES